MLGIALESTTQNEKKCNVLFEDGSCCAGSAGNEVISHLVGQVGADVTVTLEIQTPCHQVSLTMWSESSQRMVGLLTSRPTASNKTSA
jgi:hypothetical protein